MRSVNGRGCDPTSHPRSSTRQGRHTPPAVSARAPGSTKPRRPWPTRWRRRCRAGCAPPEDHRAGLAVTDTVRVLMEIGGGIANDQCPTAERGGAAIEAEGHAIGTVEVWWRHAWGAVNREVATHPGRPPHRLGLGAGGSVQSAVGCALSPSLRGVVARRRAGLDAGGQLLGAPNAAATTRQTRTAETRHDHAGGRGRAQGHRRRGPR